MTLDLSRIRQSEVANLDDRDLAALLGRILDVQREDRRLNQILYYRPAAPRAMLVHESRAKLIGVGGGNGSSKTESSLVEVISRATGIFPKCLAHTAAWKFRGPINCRIVVESITTTLYKTILPKLQWNKWTGVDEPDGERGHWGWVPKNCLIKESWDKSWSSGLRTLTVLCRDPGNPERIVGESEIQFMSHDQNPEDFASGDFHVVMLDEPPNEPIFKENQARTMRVDGLLLLAMTWPDDPTIPVDYIYDNVYAKGIPGPDKVEHIDWFELVTTENRTLDQKAIQRQMSQWDEATRTVRIAGKPIRFANRVHAGFMKSEDHWCFRCMRGNFTPAHDAARERLTCPHCGSDDIEAYQHVVDFEPQPSWPTVCLLDPHPRKPNMFLWVQIDPADDFWVTAELLLDGSPEDCKRACDDIEREHHLNVALRLMDPNMGRSPSSAKDRDVNWQGEFELAGLRFDLANDSDVGRKRLDTFLQPDRSMRQPRIHFHPRVKNCILHLERFVWDDHKRMRDRDQKQTTRQKYDDFPALLRYLMNYEPTFQLLQHGARVFTREGRRRGY